MRASWVKRAFGLIVRQYWQRPHHSPQHQDLSPTCFPKPTGMICKWLTKWRRMELWNKRDTEVNHLGFARTPSWFSRICFSNEVLPGKEAHSHATGCKLLHLKQEPHLIPKSHWEESLAFGERPSQLARTLAFWNNREIKAGHNRSLIFSRRSSVLLKSKTVVMGPSSCNTLDQATRTTATTPTVKCEAPLLRCEAANNQSWITNSTNISNRDAANCGEKREHCILQESTKPRWNMSTWYFLVKITHISVALPFRGRRISSCQNVCSVSWTNPNNFRRPAEHAVLPLASQEQHPMACLKETCFACGWLGCRLFCNQMSFFLF